ISPTGMVRFMGLTILGDSFQRSSNAPTAGNLIVPLKKSQGQFSYEPDLAVPGAVFCDSVRTAGRQPAKNSARAGVGSIMSQPARLTVPVGERPINLTQVLKVAGCVPSGGAAKALITEGLVRVNGEVELRKRRQMKAGDTVTLQDGPTIVLTADA